MAAAQPLLGAATVPQVLALLGLPQGLWSGQRRG
jgi:hypothetical protein